MLSESQLFLLHADGADDKLGAKLIDGALDALGLEVELGIVEGDIDGVVEGEIDGDVLGLEVEGWELGTELGRAEGPDVGPEVGGSKHGGVIGMYSIGLNS